jgi:hypothetical protein
MSIIVGILKSISEFSEVKNEFSETNNQSVLKSFLPEKLKIKRNQYFSI